MVKVKRIHPLHLSLFIIIAVILTSLLFISSAVFFFERNYAEKVYPGVRIDNISFGGKTVTEVEEYFRKKNEPFEKLTIVLQFEDKIATLSATELTVGLDEKLAGHQAYSIGRSGHILSDTYQKWKAATVGINLSSVLTMNSEFIDETLNQLSLSIDIPEQNALFQFEKGKVVAFKPSKEGRRLNKEQTKKLILSRIEEIAEDHNSNAENLVISSPVESVLPAITTENSNNFGIKELIGVGNSKFVGSIPGRVHNITLAASRINGKLIPPGSVFSFNDAIGDVSGSTGFQPAYIIKDGRTVLGDGGGVCQVSTTLFRAALNAGLPIEERHAHSYRVSYYEQDSPPGLDATVFAPNYDLKFKNDTGNYILIQTRTDRQNYTLTFELYGAGDGRRAEVTKPVIFSQTPPPPDLYQDDPTLPKGTVKQVDWKAWGAKVSFDYKVTREEEVLFQKNFFSAFQPWQAVFLQGTRG